MQPFARTVEAILARSPHFRELPAAARTRLAGTCVQTSLSDRAPYLGRFGIVVSGALELAMAFPPSRPRTFGVLGAGSFFSLSTLIGAPRPTRLCRAVGHTVIADIPWKRLRALQGEDAALEAHVGRLIGSRLNAAVSLLADVTWGALPRSLARRLMAQLLASGPTRAGQPVELPMSQRMLCDLVGAGRSSVNAELMALEQAGALRRAYRRIVVLDAARLDAAAGPDVTAL
jgi:CRP-like cAMP-binding protein